MNYLQYLIYFLIGGTILSSVHYFANHLHNTSLAALCALFPIGLLCAFIIEERKQVVSYVFHLSIVYILSLVAVFFLWCGLQSNVSFSIPVWLCLALLLWIILQYFKILWFSV